MENVLPFYKANCRNKSKYFFSYISQQTASAPKEFLEAIAKLPDSIREKAEFWIVGAGRLSDELTSYADIYPCIKILGEIDNREMNTLYNQLDVVVCASRVDALPVVVAEGCMTQKTCIVSNATGVAEFLEHGKTGLIFESENVDELSGWINWAVEHSEEVEQIGFHSERCMI